MEVQFLPSGDMGITVEFGKEISLEINTKVRMLHHDLKEHPIDGVIETIPTYSALLVIYRPDVLLFDALVEILRERIEHMQGGVEKMKTSVTEIPVLYGGKWEWILRIVRRWSIYRKKSLSRFIQAVSIMSICWDLPRDIPMRPDLRILSISNGGNPPD